MPLTDSLRDDILASVPSLRAFAISLSGNGDRADGLGPMQRSPHDDRGDQFLEGRVAISVAGRQHSGANGDPKPHRRLGLGVHAQDPPSPIEKEGAAIEGGEKVDHAPLAGRPKVQGQLSGPLHVGQ